MCADCDRRDNSWASVSHGVFICSVCADVHRSMGTHLSKVKACTGMWAPDELEKMRSIGNQGGDEIYGAEKIVAGSSKEQKQHYVVEKYEKRSFAGSWGWSCRDTPSITSTHTPVKHEKQTEITG